MAGGSDVQLFGVLARAAEWRIGDFDAQYLVNTAWVFAKACQPDAHLLGAFQKAP